MCELYIFITNLNIPGSVIATWCIVTVLYMVKGEREGERGRERDRESSDKIKSQNEECRD